MKNTIISMVLDKRTQDAPNVQEILTRHGCNIKVRLGIHEIQGCSDNGLILLVAGGEDNEVEELVKELEEHPRVKVKTMDIM